MKVHKVCESLRLNAAQVDELTLQYGGIREGRYDVRFKTAVNLSIDFNLNIVLRVCYVSEVE